MLKIPPKTEYVVNTLLKNGYEAYIVGGCVRDMLLKKIPIDYDVTTSATPKTVLSLFEKTIATGIKHGTVTVIIENQPIEVTTYRTESGYNDNRHPENVTFVTSLKEDLSRRDFTVNAMAFNHQNGLQDYFNGKQDLNNKILRAVGNPYTRFKEDALRILRLFRFSSVLSFDIEKETIKAAMKLSNTLSNISRERIASELKKAVMGENVSSLKPLIESNGLSFLNINKIPDFNIIKRCNKTEKLAMFSFCFLSDCNISNICYELKLSNEYKTYFEKMFCLCSMKFPKDKIKIKKMLYMSDVSIFKDYLLFCNANLINTKNQSELLEEIIKNNEPYLISHLKISGNDIKSFGYKDKEIGEILEKLRLFVLENPSKNTCKDLIETIQKL